MLKTEFFIDKKFGKKTSAELATVMDSFCGLIEKMSLKEKTKLAELFGTEGVNVFNNFGIKSGYDFYLLANRDPRPCIIWSWDDVQSLRPKWGKKKCENALYSVKSILEDRSTEEGWQILDDALDCL